jgi:hypothetical protein
MAPGSHAEVSFLVSELGLGGALAALMNREARKRGIERQPAWPTAQTQPRTSPEAQAEQAESERWQYRLAHGYWPRAAAEYLNAKRAVAG